MSAAGHQDPAAGAGSAVDLLRGHIASGLSAAAGRHAFSNRRRRFDVGYSERMRRRAMRSMAILSFLVIVAGPMLIAGTYYGAVAEDQYAVESRMILRVNQAAGPDRLEALTGLPSIEMKRDTQVVAAFMESSALVEALVVGADFPARYAGVGADLLRPESWTATDWPARLPPDPTVEDFEDQWARVSEVEIELPAGIIVFSLRAFSAADAQALATAAVTRAERLVQEMNARVWTEAVASAERAFAAATERLVSVQHSLAAARNAAGILDAEREAGALSALSADLRGQIIALEQRRAAQARHLAPSSPRLRALSDRIAALETQLDRLGAKAVGTSSGLSEVMADFSQIEIARETAERQFLAAARTLEETRHAAEARMIYLDVFVPPERPEEATYPRRWRSLALILGACLAAWGVAFGLFSLVRRHMA
ncbi:MAG: hypothetical protein ACFBRM_10225 [Pikeienuella sp.]